MTTLEKLREIRERADKATKGPWEHMGGSGIRVFGIPKEDPGWKYGICNCHTVPPDDGDVRNAEFIAHSRSDIPALVEALVEALEAIDRSIARSDDYGDSHCSQPIRQARTKIEQIMTGEK
jgi:hypothetical protein